MKNKDITERCGEWDLDIRNHNCCPNNDYSHMCFVPNGKEKCHFCKKKQEAYQKYNEYVESYIEEDGTELSWEEKDTAAYHLIKEWEEKE